MSCWREAVPPAHLPTRFTLCREDRAEGLLVLQPRGYFTAEYCESGVILGCGLVVGFLTFQVAVRPLAEPACRDIFCSQRERCRLNLRCFERYLLKKREDVVTISCSSVHSVARCCIFCCSCLCDFLVVLIIPDFFVPIRLLCSVLRLLLGDPLGENIQELLRCGLSDCE